MSSGFFVFSYKCFNFRQREPVAHFKHATINEGGTGDDKSMATT
jgi:hypothetical protein